MSKEIWDLLLTEVETACDDTKTIDRKKVLDATDRLYDMIRSNEIIPDSYLKRLFTVFSKFFEKFGNHWIIISTTCFVLKHLYGVVPIDYFKEFHIIHWLLQYSGNSKREIRDAVGQSLGSLTRAYDRDVMCAGIHDFVSKERKTAEEVEGFMVALGYIASNLIGSDSELINILIVHCDDTKFDTYSAYVRTQALRGLARVMKAKPSLPLELMSKIEKCAFSRLGDENINVRKEAARLCNVLGFSAEQLVSKLEDLLKQSPSWETRFGVCFAFHTLALNTPAIHEMNVEMLKSVFETLKLQVEMSDKNINAYNASSVAGQAIVQFFVSIQCDLNLLMKYSSLDFSLYDLYVHPTLIYMFKSSIAQLLDGAGTSLMNLLTKTPKSIKEKDRLLVYLFKNRYHASGPIAISAKVVWQFGKSDDDYLNRITAELIAFLIEESTNANFEVRESVFKAMDEVFAITNFEKLDVVKCFTTIITGATTTGPNSECPRSAAINAAGSLVSYCSRIKVDISQTAKHLASISLEFLAELDESIIFATLSLIRALLHHYPEVILKDSKLAAVILCLSKDDALDNDNIKYLALQLSISMSRNIRETIGDVILALSKPYTLVDETDVEKKEAASRVYRVLSEYVDEKTVFTVDQVKKCVDDFTHGLFEEKDSNIILANTLLAITGFCKNQSFNVGLNSVGKVFSNKLAIYFGFILANKQGDFEEDEEEIPKLKTPYPFNAFNLARLKAMIDVLAKIRHFIAPENLGKYLNTYSQLFFQQDPQYKPYITLVLVQMINEKLQSNGIMALAKGYVTEFDVHGSMSTTQVVVDQCVGLLKSPTYAQVPLDKKIVLYNHLISAMVTKRATVEGILDILIEKSRTEKDSIIQGRMIQLLSLIAFDDSYLNVVAEFFFVKQNFASDDEELLFYEVPVFAKVVVDPFSPFYVNSLILSTLKKWWNESRAQNVNVTDEKIQQLICGSLFNGFLFPYEEALLTRIEFVNEQYDSLWKWRILSVFHHAKPSTEFTIKWLDLTLKLIQEARRKVSNKTYVAIITSCCSAVLASRKQNPEFLQLLSEAFVDEELEEERLLLGQILRYLQSLDSNPVILPKPRILAKVEFNSTFSKNQ